MAGRNGDGGDVDRDPLAGGRSANGRGAGLPAAALVGKRHKDGGRYGLRGQLGARGGESMMLNVPY